jgi:RNA-directed DNA polymerase
MKSKREKSDPSIVAQMSANKPGQPGAESAEPREGTEGNASNTRAGHRAGKACPRGSNVYEK